MSKPTASGMARTTETTQIKTISTAVHFGTPIPLIRLQDATARYLKCKLELLVKWAKPGFVELHSLFSEWHSHPEPT